jgi:hypothetical protein
VTAIENENQEHGLETCIFKTNKITETNGKQNGADFVLITFGQKY